MFYHGRNKRNFKRDYPRTRLCSGEKGNKWAQIGKIAASKVSLVVAWGGGKGGGAWRHAFDAAVPWYQTFRLSLGSEKSKKYTCDLLQKEREAFKIWSFSYTILW